MRNTKKACRSTAPNLLVQLPLAELTLQLVVDPSKSRRSIPARVDGKSRRSIPAKADGRSQQEPTVDPDTQHHPISRSPGHRVPDLCLTIPISQHQVSYSCYDTHRCMPYRTCHLHTKRQANTIFHTNKDK
jgi:hypothetical protein